LPCEPPTWSFLVHEPAFDELAGNVFRQIAPLLERQPWTEQPIERGRTRHSTGLYQP
jgi:hypothetical protein